MDLNVRSIEDALDWAELLSSLNAGVEELNCTISGNTGDDWIWDIKNEKYVWDESVSSPETTPEGFEYIGASLQHVEAHHRGESSIAFLFSAPEFGEDRTPWPGEIMQREPTAFEKVRDFGVAHHIPFSETTYNILDDVAVFITSFDLLNPKGQPLHLDGSVPVRGSQEHINSGINGYLTILPLPKFNFGGVNIAKANKFFKGTRYNRISPKVKGMMLRVYNYTIQKTFTTKKLFKETKSVSEKYRDSEW